MKLAFVFAVFLTAVLAVQTEDHRAAVVTSQTVAATEPFVSPLDAPRCRKVNAAGEPLKLETAERGDDREWTITCIYEEFR